MIKTCPFCGHDLSKELIDGLTSCGNCGQIFDASDMNQLLSAGWLIRKHHYNHDQLKWHTKLDDHFLRMAMKMVGEENLSHQEYLKYLTKKGISNKSYLKSKDECFSDLA